MRRPDGHNVREWREYEYWRAADPVAWRQLDTTAYGIALRPWQRDAIKAYRTVAELPTERPPFIVDTKA